MRVKGSVVDESAGRSSGQHPVVVLSVSKKSKGRAVCAQYNIMVCDVMVCDVMVCDGSGACRRGKP